MKNRLKNMSSYSKKSAVAYGIVIIAFVLVTALDSMGFITNSLYGQLVPICAYVSLAISLNLVVGISGELSLGHAGFMSIGAFSGVIVSTCLQHSIVAPMPRLLIAMAVGALVAAVAGVIIGIPVLRLRGDYLAIVTLAFGEIIRNILNITYVGLDSAGLRFATSVDKLGLDPVDGKMILNGPMGATGVQKLSTFGMGIVVVLITLFVVQNLINSKQGRAIMAIRDNRIAAESVGLNITNFKLTAFVTSAALAGMAGALFGLNYSTIAPVKFNFNTSILILVFVVLGGMGNIIGSIISATVLVILPEALREFADYRMLMYAIVLILVMLATNNMQFRAMIDKVLGKIKGTVAKGNRKKEMTEVSAEGGMRNE